MVSTRATPKRFFGNFALLKGIVGLRALFNGHLNRGDGNKRQNCLGTSAQPNILHAKQDLAFDVYSGA